MNNRQLAAVLTGLRLYQETETLSPDLQCIATNGDQTNPLSNEEVDDLIGVLQESRPCIVATGNCFTGMVFYGPFSDFDTAVEWAETMFEGEWSVTQLETAE